MEVRRRNGRIEATTKRAERTTPGGAGEDIVEEAEVATPEVNDCN